ncbi:FecCD family ABC transporter permease [Gordonia zhaorongruii]|uniref:FecCD family ABC transporter permease n=1 Tax=Gordonia zhaorongruii TaxID=2597659 RepID=UPI00104FD1DF|nr:iron ABC transporter permease [Gordonia zhaorongruii]
MTEPQTTRHAVQAGRRQRTVRRHTIVGGLALLTALLFVVSLMVGQTFYGIDEVFMVLRGDQIAGASFTVGDLRLPRVTLALLAGFAFGFAGVTFQTLLRNPLASPDIIGISWGASAAAVVGIVIFGLTGPSVSAAALCGAVGAAAAVYGLSQNGGFAATRLILIGIGIGAMLSSVVSWVLARASEWDIQAALQWITGSLAQSSWEAAAPLALAVAIIVPLMLLVGRDIDMLRLGDDTAAGMGVRVEATRVAFLLGAVILLAFATAATGPISFVAFMAGPIASRLIAGGERMLLPSGLIGAIIVMSADLVAQFALPHRYPVGVITGVLGAPFLIYLLIRVNRSGGTL